MKRYSTLILWCALVCFPLAVKGGETSTPPQISMTAQCLQGLADLANFQLTHRLEGLAKSIELLRKVESENPKYIGQQIKQLQAEMVEVLKWGLKHEENALLDVDSYKVSQSEQYPPNMSRIFAYLESRGGKYDKTPFFGLQYILKKYFSKPITPAMVEQAKVVYAAHGEPFNYEGWMYIAKELGGILPLSIRAVPEGTVVPTKNILMSVESTDPKCAWAVGWFETQFMRLWYPTTVDTLSYHIRDTIQEALDNTSDSPKDSIMFKLHDFGGRGVSSRESAGIGGLAHLTNFKGTDTVAALVVAMTYYQEAMAGYSIPASEHSTMTSWGGISGEPKAMENMIDKFGKKGGIFACVSDSYNLWNAIENIWGGTLKKKLLDSGATLVVRPDSGDPAPTVLKTLQLLEKKFGATTNKKGFKVLNNVRVLQGDGINHESIKEILKLAIDNGYSADNLAFGMGGALLQGPNRDTQQFAFKASWGVVDGNEIEIFKDPITATGTKTSKKGRLDLVDRDGKLQTVRETDHPDSVMRKVWENGVLLVDDPFSLIRERQEASREKK